MDMIDAMWYGAVTPGEVLEKQDEKQKALAQLIERNRAVLHPDAGCHPGEAGGQPGGASGLSIVFVKNRAGLLPGVVVLVCAARRERICSTSYNTNRTTEEKTKRGFGSGVRTGAVLWIMRGCEHESD